MEIGQALRFERLNLGLSQQDMCSGIISRPHYAKVEKGDYVINSENLFQILFKHQIDIIDFYKLIQSTYDSNENEVDNRLQNKMNYAVNAKNIKKLEKYCEEILVKSNNEILKLRAIVTVAYFKGEIDKLSVNTKEKLKKEFDEGNHWTKRPELLRLFANTMPLWSQEELDFFIGRLLSVVNDKNISELMLERYLRLFANYLTTCYDRKVIQKENRTNHVKEVVDYMISNTSNFHLMMYRVIVIYLDLLLKGKKSEAKEVEEDMKKYGYGCYIASWPK